MGLRDIDNYPPQEPFSEIGVRYHIRTLELGAGVCGESFAYGDDPYQEVAVFSAPKPTGDVIAFMHGGGWTNGYKEWLAFMAPPLTAAGITFVSMGYRLAPAVIWPAGVEDAAAGIKWVHANIAAHGGDRERIFVGGHSAGGHQATWLAVRDDWQQAAGVPEDVIRGVLPVSGVYDFTEAGGMRAGTVKSAIGLGGLLWAGIGDTVRVSLSADPTEEVRVAYEMLKSLGLRRRGVTVISCPSCARQQFDVISTVQVIEERLEHIDVPMTVSIIGCVVNGPGEARETDIGLTGGGKGTHQVYVSGLADHRLTNGDIVEHVVGLVEARAAEIKAAAASEPEAAQA